MTKGKTEVVFDKKNVVVACDVVNGKITHVDCSSELLGTVFAGDVLVSVNGDTNIKTTQDFSKTVHAKLPGKLTIEYMRDDECAVETKALTARRPTSEMMEISLKYRSGGATGILIHRMSGHPATVMIAMVETGSMASKTIKAGDILVKVNDTYVLDRDAARKLLYSSVNSTKQVTLTIERAVGQVSLGPAPPPPAGAKTTANSLVSAPSLASISTMSTASVIKVNKQLDKILPADVLELLKKHHNFFKVECTLPPCLKKVKDDSIPSALSVSTESMEVQIPFDPSTKPLRVTPKRVGS